MLDLVGMPVMNLSTVNNSLWQNSVRLGLIQSPDGSSPAHRRQSERLKQLLQYNDFPKSQYCMNLDCSNWALHTLKGDDSPFLNPGDRAVLGVKTLKDHFKTEY